MPDGTLFPMRIYQIHGVEISEIELGDTPDESANKIMERVGNWAQPYRNSEEILRFIEAQFKDVERIKSLINGK